MPRVSVVVPTFNRGGLLVEAVRSALVQTVTDIEVIVADDGSTDGSPELVDGLGDERVRVLRLGHSGLLGVVRNAAVIEARSEFVAFLDSDDFWVPHKLELQVDRLDHQSTVGLVCSNAYVVDQQGAEVRPLYLPPGVGASGDVLAQLLFDNFVIVSSVMARRTLIEEAGYFTEYPRLRGVEDYDLWLRLASACTLTYLPQPLTAYREHGGSMRREVTPSGYWGSALIAMDNLSRFLGPLDPRLESVRRRRAQILVEIARTKLLGHKPAGAARSLIQALRLDPAAAASHIISGRTISGTRKAIRDALGRSAVA